MTGAGLDALRDIGGRDTEGRDVDDRAMLRAGDEAAVERADDERAGDEDAGDEDGKDDECDDEALADTRVSAAGRDEQPALATRSSSASAHRSNLIMGPSSRSADWQAIRRTRPAMPSCSGEDRAVIAGVTAAWSLP